MEKTNKSPLVLLRDFKRLKFRVVTIENNFRKHLNEPTASIMVKGKNGQWSGWSGIFYLADEDKMESILNKIEKYYDRYLKNKYPNKEFCIIKTIDGERIVHKILKQR